MPAPDVARCRACRERIEFAVSETSGKRVPINLLSETSQKDPRATWAVYDREAGGYFVRKVTAKQPFDVENEHLAINHFSVCAPSVTHSVMKPTRRTRGRARSRT